MKTMFPLIISGFDEEAAKYTSADAKLFNVNGQVLFPQMTDDGQLAKTLAFFVGNGNLEDSVEGTFEMGDFEDKIRMAVRQAFATYKLR